MISILQVLGSAVLISFSVVFIKLAQMGPTVIGFYRMLFGGLVLLVLAIVRRDTMWTGRTPFMLAVGAAIFLATDFIFWHMSIYSVGPGLAAILANLQVFVMPLVGFYYYREQLSFRLAWSIPIALGGLLMLVGPGWSNLGDDYRLGVVYGLITALCYVGYLFCLRRSREVDKPLPLVANMAILSLTGAVMLAFTVPVMGESFVIPNTQSWLCLLGLGVISQAVGWLIITSNLAKIDASKVGLVLLVQPTLSFVWDIVIFDRPTDYLDGLGAAITLTAIYLGLTSKSVKK